MLGGTLTLGAGMLQKCDLVPIVQRAFAPLACVAELQNYEHAFGFAVYLPDGSRIVYEEKNITILLNEAVLNGVIHQVRQRVEAKGVTLTPWMPSHSS